MMPGSGRVPADQVFAYPPKKGTPSPDRSWPEPTQQLSEHQAEKTQELSDLHQVSLESPRVATAEDFFCATRRYADPPLPVAIAVSTGGSYDRELLLLLHVSYHLYYVLLCV